MSKNGGNMAAPDYQKFMLPVLRHAANGETSAQDCIQKIAQDFGLSDEDCEEMLPSKTKDVTENDGANFRP